MYTYIHTNSSIDALWRTPRRVRTALMRCDATIGVGNELNGFLPFGPGRSNKRHFFAHHTASGIPPASRVVTEVS